MRRMTQTQKTYLDVFHSVSANYYFRYTLVFVAAAAIAFFPVYINGKSFTIYYDGLEQHFTWFVYEGRWIRQIISNVVSGATPILPQWTFDLGYGADIISSMSNWIGDPINLLSALCPERYSGYLFTALWVGRCWLSGITFSFFCLRKGKQPWAVLSASIVYCLGGYAITAFVHPNFFCPLIILPLIFAGADNLFENRSPLLLIVSVFLAFASWFYFAYMICLMLLVYCLVCYFAGSRPTKSVVDFIQLVAKFFACLVLGAAMAALLLFPIVSAQLGASRLAIAHTIPALFLEESGLPLYYLNFLGSFISYSQISIDASIGFGAAGALCVLVLFVADKTRERRWIKVWFLVLTAFALVPVFGWMMNGFSYVSNRWIFGYAFCACYIIADVLPDLPIAIARRKGLIAAISSALSILLVLCPQTRTIQIVFCLMCLFALLFLSSTTAQWTRRTKYAAVTATILCPVLCCMMLWSAQTGNAVFDRVPIRLIESKVFSSEFAQNSEDMKNTNYRVDSNRVARPANSSLLLGLRSIDFYDNLYNSNVARYHSQLGLIPDVYKEEYRYTDLDSRTVLDAVSGVKRFVIPDGGASFLPYDRKKEQVTSSGDSQGYNLSWALPIAFTYKERVSTSSWESVSPLERQEVLLERCVLDDAQDGNQSPSLQAVKRKASERLSSGLVHDGNAFITTEPGASVTLSFEGASHAETYLSISNLDYEPMGVVDAAGDSFSSLTRYEKNQLQLQDSMSSQWYGSSYWNATSFSLDISSAAYGSWTESNFWTKGGDFYTGQDNWLINCGYSEEPQTEITITFPKPGYYTMDLEVLCQSMDGFEDKVAALAEDPVENFELSTNRISGSVSCSQDELIYMSIPWAEGWSATLDGEPVEVKKANVAFMAIEAGEGYHEFELKYSNPMTERGLVVSVVAWMLFIGLAITLKTRARRRAGQNEE